MVEYLPLLTIPFFIHLANKTMPHSFETEVQNQGVTKMTLRYKYILVVPNKKRAPRGPF